MGTPPKSNQARSLESALSRLVVSPGGRMKMSAAFDVKQSASEMILLVDLPGVDEDEIQISEGEGVLRVCANREFNHDLEDAEEYTHLGRAYGTFQCSVELPPSADANSMTAKYTRGVLKIRIPKRRT